MADVVTAACPTGEERRETDRDGPESILTSQETMSTHEAGGLADTRPLLVDACDAGPLLPTLSIPRSGREFSVLPAQPCMQGAFFPGGCCLACL